MNTETDTSAAASLIDCGQVNDAYLSENNRLRTKLVYFYYMKGHDVTAYVTKRDSNVDYVDIQSEIQSILDDISSGRLHPAGWNLGDIRWRGKSFFILFYEDEADELSPCKAVTFRYVENNNKTDNHSFRDGRDIPKSQSNWENVSIFYCLNHQRKRGGGDLHKRDEERFEMEVGHTLRAGGRPALGHSDSGTNTGPP